MEPFKGGTLITNEVNKTLRNNKILDMIKVLYSQSFTTCCSYTINCKIVLIPGTGTVFCFRKTEPSYRLGDRIFIYLGGRALSMCRQLLD